MAGKALQVSGSGQGEPQSVGVKVIGMLVGHKRSVAAGLGAQERPQRRSA